MNPHEAQWRVVGCGNPRHGPEWACWKVKNADGRAVLSNVDKATAERYAAFPAMARALRDLLCDPDSGKAQRAAEAALKEAGVLE